MTFLEYLADVWNPTGDLTAGALFYPYPPSALVAPAVVARPDNPWIEPDEWCTFRERWLLIAVVSAADPPSLMARLEELAVYVVDLVAATAPVTGAAWDRTDTPFLDETLGVPLMTAAAHITRPHDPIGA